MFVGNPFLNLLNVLILSGKGQRNNKIKIPFFTIWDGDKTRMLVMKKNIAQDQVGIIKLYA